jgi:cytochrome c oxidase cbb3-type subunit 3
MTRALLFSWFAIAAIGADTETKVKLPSSRADMIHGEKLFQVHCARCHGPKGEGSRGPTLIRARLIHAPDDAALVAVIDDGIRGTEMPGAEAMSHHEILQTAAFVRSLGKVPQQPVPGDPARGAEIYRTKGNCGACHSISGEGGVAGPDLTQIGEARSPAYLRESIVDPQAAVPEGYVRLTVVLPMNGYSVTGVRVNEDSFSIQVRDDSGRSYSWWKSDIARIDKPKDKSPMPSYRGQLSDPELTDLVAYLASLKERK